MSSIPHGVPQSDFSRRKITLRYAAFSPSAGGSGHAVAVHQKGLDEFVFFGPNYGAFRYAKENLMNCFQHLFWAPFITAPKDLLDGKKAEYLRREKLTDKVEDRWDKMGYTIFARK